MTSLVLPESSQPHKTDTALLQMKSQGIRHVGAETQDSSLEFRPCSSISRRFSGGPGDESAAPGKGGQEEGTGCGEEGKRKRR